MPDVTILAASAIAAVVRSVGVTTPGEATNLVAIALAESSGELEAVNRTRRGLWQLDDSLGYDQRRMVADAGYAAQSVAKLSRGGTDLTYWTSYVTGTYQNFLNQARQGMAQSAAIVGTVLSADGSYVPSTPGGYNESVAAGKQSFTLPGPGVVTAASMERQRPLYGLKIIGTETEGDFSSAIIGDVAYSAGWAEIPNLKFVIADPQGDLLWQQRNIWVRGARVTYLDLDFRIDEITFSPGGHGTGQIELSCIDGIVYALQQLRGARTEKTSVANWLRGELQRAGLDPNRYLLAEQGSAVDISRDVPAKDAKTTATGGDIPSAWTTAVRLAEENGKRLFISGQRLIYGSAAFAMQWAAPGDLRIGWHASPEGERWLSLPTAKQNSSGSNGSTSTEVTGKIPFNRAMYFRPGVSVIVHNTPSIAAGDRQFVVSSISYSLGSDTDGAEVNLSEPVELEKKAS